MGKYNNRVIVSMDRECPMGCKHCYSFAMTHSNTPQSDESVISRAKKSAADIVYLSEKTENFFDEREGYELCKCLFEECKKDIFVITRSFLSDETIQQLATLDQQMKQTANALYLAVSVCAHESYGITEDIHLCPTPDARISNLKRASALGIHTILMVRPVFPSKMVPIKEYLELVDQCNGNVDVVVTSGLIVTDSILKRLGVEREFFSYMACGDSSYLADLEDKSISYVNVEAELQEIENKCSMCGIPYYRHTMPALNWIADKQR